MEKQIQILTDKKKIFVDAYMANGFNASKAYMTAYPDANKQSAGVLGHLLKADPAVKMELDAMYKTLRESNMNSIEERFLALKNVMIDCIEKNDKQNLLKTIDLINKMTGAYTLQIDANIQQAIQLIIPGMEKTDEETKEIE